ncbi:MAG: YdcF family protein [Rubrobacter sp.]|nr:YdcF family protein [Rubrobacter sp.]
MGILGDLSALVRLYRGDASVFRREPRGPDRVAVVLGAQVLRGGRPSAVLEARSLHAAGMYHRGEAGLLVPSGGVGEHPPSEAAVAAGVLRRAGVPGERILLEDRSGSTLESARRVAGVLREREVTEVVAVTDPLHCVRAVAALREEGIKCVPEPVYSSPAWRVPRMRREQFARELGAVVWYRTRWALVSSARR